MRKLGNKNEARKLAQEAGVPVVPGSEGLIQTRTRRCALARAIGYPVLIKAAAGGGGRGMRVARNDISLQSGLKAAQQEAEAAFKDGSVYLEKYIEQPRHIEVQILGDRHGNVVHLWERDCSLQRRHQKLVEESPAPNLPDEVRTAICAAAVRLVKAAGYYNAGTCEFLVDKRQQLLLHRGQRPHPGRASGHGAGHRHRPGARADPHRRRRDACVSHSRTSFTAARPSSAASTPRTRPHDFRPSPGLITRWQPPGGPGVRLDTHVVAGYRVPPNYDSLVAKLLVHQPTRAEAIAVHAAVPWPSSSSKGSRRRSRCTARSSTTPPSSRAGWIRRSSNATGGCATAEEPRMK